MAKKKIKINLVVNVNRIIFDLSKTLKAKYMSNVIIRIAELNNQISANLATGGSAAEWVMLVKERSELKSQLA